MVNLRKANIGDYLQYSLLYSNSSYQWLYVSDSKTSMNESADKVIQNLCMDMDTINSFFENLTIDRFEKELSYEDSYIFIVEQDKQIIGYVTLFKYPGRGNYRITEWAMNEYDLHILYDIILLIENLIKKEKRLSYLTVFPSSQIAKKYLLEMGFENTGSGIYQRNKRSK